MGLVLATTKILVTSECTQILFQNSGVGGVSLVSTKPPATLPSLLYVLMGVSQI